MTFFVIANIFLGMMFVVLVFFMFALSAVLGTLNAVRKAARAQAADPTQPHISDMRLVLQHNDPVSQSETQLTAAMTFDPQFSPDSFFAAASDAFKHVVTFDGSTPPAQLPVTAAYAQKLAQQAQTLAGGFASVVDNVQLNAPTLAAVRVDSQQQSIDVCMTGSWVTNVRSSDGSIMDGSTTPVPFAKRATFVRAAHCPHCGGEVAGATAVCPFCGTQLDWTSAGWLVDAVADAPRTTMSASAAAAATSATLGLLLSGISKDDHSPATLALGKNLRAAVQQIQSRDSHFSQDRFMRWATQTYLNERRSQNPGAITIQKADLFAAVITSTSENILVLFTSVGSDGRKHVEGVDFIRPAGSQTPTPPVAAPDTACSECGAPLGAADAACRFCNTPIPDDAGGWKLETIKVQISH